MKYWLITSEFPPMYGGGISTYCWHTAQMLVQKGHKVTVFTQDFNIDGVAESSPMAGLRLIRLHPFRNPKTRVLGYEARLSYELSTVVEEFISREGRPDFIEVQDYMGIGYYILLKKALKYDVFNELPIILTAHAPSFLYLDYNQVPMYKLPDFWTGEMEKVSIRMADILLFPSRFLIDILQPRMDFTNLKPIQLFNPYKPESPKNKIASNKIGKLSFFGKLTPQKGGLELLSYMRRMWDQGFDMPVTIIGGDDHFFYPVQQDMGSYLKSKFKRYFERGLISFTGNLSPEKLSRELDEARIIIVPSIVDNLPYTVIEAMSRGKIILASDDGGQRELIEHGKSGFIFSHRVPGDFEEKLRHILSLDEALLNTISAEAQKRSHDLCSYEHVYEQKMRILQSYSNHTSNHFVYKEEDTNAAPPEKRGLEPNRLSVVVPYYNMGAYLEDALQSLMKVPLSNMEIIVVNDGSTDPASIAALEVLGHKYPFKVHHQQNMGLSLARNEGAKLATGKFLAFLDPDDMVEPEYYPKAIEILIHYKNVHFVGCWAAYFGDNDELWPSFNPEPPYLLFHNLINSSALVYKTESFLAYGANDPKMIYGMEDYEGVISMVSHGAKGVSIPEPWWNYRIRQNSMQQVFTQFSQLYLYRLIANKHREYFSRYASELSNLLNHNGPGYKVGNPTWEIITPNHSTQQVQLNGRLTQFVKRHPMLKKAAKWIYLKLIS